MTSYSYYQLLYTGFVQGQAEWYGSSPLWNAFAHCQGLFVAGLWKHRILSIVSTVFDHSIVSFGWLFAAVDLSKATWSSCPAVQGRCCYFPC
jgi:hypothetical protein